MGRVDLKALKFYFTIVFPLSVILFQYEPSLRDYLCVPGLAIILMSLLDLTVSEEVSNIENKDSFTYKIALWLFVPAHLAMLAFTIYSMIYIDFSMSQTICLILSSGFIAGTFGLVAAHELMHGSKFDQQLSMIVLYSVNYPHLYIQHLRIHHVWVATVEDNGTSRYGESIYQFLPRAIIDGYTKSWKSEHNRLKNNSFIKRWIK